MKLRVLRHLCVAFFLGYALMTSVIAERRWLAVPLLIGLVAVCIDVYRSLKAEL